MLSCFGFSWRWRFYCLDFVLSLWCELFTSPCTYLESVSSFELRARTACDERRDARIIKSQCLFIIACHQVADSRLRLWSARISCLTPRSEATGFGRASISGFRLGQRRLAPDSCPGCSDAMGAFLKKRRSTQVSYAVQAIRLLRSRLILFFDIPLLLHENTQNYNATIRSPSTNAVGMLPYFLFLFAILHL